jgi:hypothetical protein
MSSENSPCNHCGEDAERFGLMHHLAWEGLGHLVFCSFPCEFIWRRDKVPEGTAATVAGIAVLAIAALT